MHAKWRTSPVTYLSIFPWLLCEISIGFFFPPSTRLLQLKLAGSQPAHINTRAHTQIQTATCRRGQTHTSKELQEGRGRTHHANRCRLLGRARHQKRNEKKGWRRGRKKKKKRGRGSKGAGLGGSGHVFQKLFCSWPPPVPLHACLAAVTERVTCHRTLQRSTR